MSQYVIIGSGVAAISAAEAIRKRDHHASVVLVSDDPGGYYSRPGLAYYLTGELDEAHLFPFGEADFQRLRLDRLMGHAERIDPHTSQVILQDRRSLAYDALLVATGAQAAALETAGSRLQGVLKLDTLEDARRILNYARRARSAVVVGGGITALEIVEGLVARRVKTHYLLRGERYWSGVLDETESRIIETRLQQEGVQLHKHAELGEVLGKDGRVAAVRTQDGRQIKTDLLVAAIGIRPRKELAENAGLKVDRGIVVDASMRSSAAHIFAAGDVAQVFDPISGRYVLDSLWSPAREQGRVAGENMAGGQALYQRGPVSNVTRLAQLTTTIIGQVAIAPGGDELGIVRGDSETWRQMPDAIAAQAGFDVNHLRLMVGENSLAGAIVMGDQILSRPLQHLISQQVDITPIRQRLLQPDSSLADLIGEFWIAYQKRDRHA